MMYVMEQHGLPIDIDAKGNEVQFGLEQTNIYTIYYVSFVIAVARE